MSAKSKANPKEKSFSEIKPGQSGCIVGYRNTDECARRLQEMGLCAGTNFRVVRVAPLGDSVEVEFRQCRLCLRRSETSEVCVIAIEDDAK